IPLAPLRLHTTIFGTRMAISAENRSEIATMRVLMIGNVRLSPRSGGKADMAIWTRCANSGSRPSRGLNPHEPQETISISNEDAQAPMPQLARRMKGEKL